MKKPRKADDLDELKQELDIDYHKITPEELYQRFQTHPENVSIVYFDSPISLYININYIIQINEHKCIIKQENYIKL